MRQVIIVNLGNNAYHMDEEAYALLQEYLDRTKAGLHNNPDIGEILGDVERSIAAKCAATLNPGKNVVSLEDMTAILEELGPVVEDSAIPEQETSHNEPARPKRLYRVREGAVVEGVCMGIAEYFNIDVVIVRVIFVALLVAGVGAAVYFVMIVAVPLKNPDPPKVRKKIHPAVWIGALIVFLLAFMTVLPWMDRGISTGRMGPMGGAEVTLLGLLALQIVGVGALLLLGYAIIRYIRHRRARE